MTRRLTLGGRCEMGLTSEHMDPETPSLISTPSKTDFWRRPSRLQICLPRLRFVGKVAMFVLFALLLFRIYYHNRPVALEPPTEAEIIEAAQREKWVWKDFPRHDGLVRGTLDLQSSCQPGQENCDNGAPRMSRYDGYRAFEESVSDVIPCFGPRGLLMNESHEDAVWAYEALAKGAVDPVLGSYEASGLDGYVSFDRVGRFQAYGIDQYDIADVSEPKTSSDVDWNEVRWGELQDACVYANRARFKPVKERQQNSIQYSNVKQKYGRLTGSKETVAAPEPGQVKKTKRTAILIRVWTGAVWSVDTVVNLRAMIAEASLASGGKYQVFILLHVKDEAVPLFVGENEPMATIRQNVPPEFHSITEVWNHAQIRSLYSNLAEHAFVGRSPWMIVQWFARNHPEFDFYYQWEFDVRYTGHYLDLFESVSSFAKKQPRKGIWERAGRVYIPAVHGDFDTQFRTHVNNEDPHHIWGPVSVEGVRPRGPKPPTGAAEDQFTWGVGEDADWVGFLPSFNVTGTRWWFKDYLWGYTQGTSTPRRATLIAQGRVSGRLLEIMNYENAENSHLTDAEMFPQTMCLHHGLKSTTFPHPIFSDRDWPAASLQEVFNPGPFGQAGGVEESTFSKWNEFAWTNMTWYFNSAQAKPVYQHFLGITALEKGGSEWEDAHGRAVIRPMLLHPVKGAKSTRWTKDGWTETKSGK